MQNRVLWSLSLAGSLAVATPHAAFGQTHFWDNFCTTGGFQACLSVDVSLVLVPVPLTQSVNGWETAITIGIRNLEGTLGSAGAWGIRGLSISGLGTSPQYLADGTVTAPGFLNSGAPAFEGSAGTTGSDYAGSTMPFSGLWSEQPGATSPGFINREAQIGDGGFAITGCTPLTPVDGLYFFEPGYMHTCGDGWVVYSFMGVPLEFTDATTVSMTGKTADGQFLSCTFGVDCQQVAVSATPEPATFALMGTGLIGICGVQLRRRRRRSA